eukprot:1645919-Amphidinium_carterae.1
MSPPSSKSNRHASWGEKESSLLCSKTSKRNHSSKTSLATRTKMEQPFGRALAMMYFTNTVPSTSLSQVDACMKDQLD